MKAQVVYQGPFNQPQFSTETTKMRKRSKTLQWLLYRLFLILNDVLMLAIGFRLAYFIRFQLSIPVFHIEVVPSFPYYSTIAEYMILIWLIIFALAGLYSRQNLLEGTFEFILVFRVVTTGVLAVIIAGFLKQEFVIARGWLLLSWILIFLFTSVGRIILRNVVFRLRHYGFFLENAIILGDNEEAKLLAGHLHDNKLSGLDIVGYVSSRNQANTDLAESVPCIGSMEQLDSLIVSNEIEELIVATSAFSNEEIMNLFIKYGLSSNINLRLSTGLFEIITTGIQVSEFANVPFMKVNQFRMAGADEIIKTIMDYGLAIPGLLLISPILIIIAIMVRLDSPGPIIHRRRVMGVNGTQFDAFKFRTMYVNGDEILSQYPLLQKELAENHKLKNDPRITRIGETLRKFSLDELPQLFNVLRHEMSLVGPRMISPEEMSKYNQWGINLLTVRPGITGLWQVSGRSDVSYEERVRMDMYYIRNWNVFLDVQLLLKTIPAIILKKGAY